VELFLAGEDLCFTEVSVPTSRFTSRHEMLRFLPKTKYVQKRRLAMVEAKVETKA
jgi:hypothetical protein